MTWDLILTSAIGQLLALGIAGAAWALLKILSLLYRIAVALRQTSLVVRVEKKA